MRNLVLKRSALVLGLALMVLAGCRKEVEKLVVQEVTKQYSWKAAGGPLLSGTRKMILGMCKDATPSTAAC